MTVFTVIFLATGCGGEEEAITIVKEGCFESYPDVPLGEAIEEYLSDVEWGTFEANGETYVDVTGKVSYVREGSGKVTNLDDGAEAFMQFNVDIETSYFEWTVYEIDGLEQSHDEFRSFLAQKQDALEQAAAEEEADRIAKEEEEADKLAAEKREADIITQIEGATPAKEVIANYEFEESAVMDITINGTSVDYDILEPSIIEDESGVEWIVLRKDEEEKTALILRKEELEFETQFNNMFGNNDYIGSVLAEEMDNYFHNNESMDLKVYALPVTLNFSENRLESTDSVEFVSEELTTKGDGEPTAFALSASDVLDAFPTSDTRIPTENGWWLRTPYSNGVLGVNEDEEIDWYTAKYTFYTSLRPAMLISLDGEVTKLNDLQLEIKEVTVGEEKREITDVVAGLIMGLESASNGGTSSSLTYYIDPDSSLYQEQIDLIDRYHQSGIHVEVVDFSIDNMMQNDDNSYTVMTIEQYKIHKNEETSDLTQNTIYTVKNIDGEFLVSSMELDN